VSNHGGRGWTIRGPPRRFCRHIAAKVKGKIPILADGCVQSGCDVLKYLALGADLVMVGRTSCARHMEAGSTESRFS